MLLAPEEIAILDGACTPKPQVVTRHGIEFETTQLLKKGLTTPSAGGFFLIPYLLQLQAHDLLLSLGPPKQEGIPNERLALGIVFESLFGYTDGIRAIDSVSRADFGLLAGLPFLPAPVTQYRFLQAASSTDALEFQVALAKRLCRLCSIVPQCAINLDGHNIKTYSRKEMKRSFLPKEGRYGKAIRTFYSQDQESHKPLIAVATYSGTTVSQVTRQVASLTRRVIGGNYLMVSDKEWYCGSLIQELHQHYGISVLTPIKCLPGRNAEFAAVPLDQYRPTLWGNIAATYTSMKDYEGPLRMLLKKLPGGKYFALVTPEAEMTPEMAMPTYSKRWRIEHFLLENDFLGVDHLPSLNLNAIQTALSLRLLAFHALDNFRRDLGGKYQTTTPRLMHRYFIDGVQGRVQLRGNTIEVSIYGFEHQAAVQPLLANLSAKLERANVDPRIPWLGNRRLCFQFH